MLGSPGLAVSRLLPITVGQGRGSERQKQREEINQTNKQTKEKQQQKPVDKNSLTSNEKKKSRENSSDAKAPPAEGCPAMATSEKIPPVLWQSMTLNVTEYLSGHQH